MRVEFELTKYQLQSGKTIAALKEVFGKHMGNYANSMRTLTIDCSAERFISFQIVRNEFGGENGFKDLKLKIIEPVQPTKTFKESFD